MITNPVIGLLGLALIGSEFSGSLCAEFSGSGRIGLCASAQNCEYANYYDRGDYKFHLELPWFRGLSKPALMVALAMMARGASPANPNTSVRVLRHSCKRIR
jgi:hypothetical protein